MIYPQVDEIRLVHNRSPISAQGYSPLQYLQQHMQVVIQLIILGSQ